MYLLDHLVHFVEKPEHLVEATKELGLHTVNGGKHDMWGTYNSLSYFGLSYIEFIGIFDKALFEKSAQEPFTLHETYKKKGYQNGVVRIAIRTNSIEKDAENLKSLGYDVNGPAEFSRRRPDGDLIQWKLLHFGKKDQSLEFPFIIQWNGSDNERYQNLVESGTIKPHPLGDLQIHEIEFAVDHLAIATEWGKALDFQVAEETEAFVKLKAQNCLLTFKRVAGSNHISRIFIIGAHEEKEEIIEGAAYFFRK